MVIVRPASVPAYVTPANVKRTFCAAAAQNVSGRAHLDEGAQGVGTACRVPEIAMSAIGRAAYQASGAPVADSNPHF